MCAHVAGLIAARLRRALCRAVRRLPSLQCNLARPCSSQQEGAGEGAPSWADERKHGDERPCGQLSLEEYLATARRLCLSRHGDWAVKLERKEDSPPPPPPPPRPLPPGGAGERQDAKTATSPNAGADSEQDMMYAVGSHAHRNGESGREKSVMYGWMPWKKKEVSLLVCVCIYIYVYICIYIYIYIGGFRDGGDGVGATEAARRIYMYIYVYIFIGGSRDGGHGVGVTEAARRVVRCRHW